MSAAFGLGFEYDPKDEIVYVYPCGTIDSDAICEEYERLCNAFYARFERKVDVIVTLEMWSVMPEMTDAYEQASRRIMERFIDLLVVVDQSPQVSVRVTSHRRTNRTVAFASSVTDATATLHQMRRDR